MQPVPHQLFTRLPAFALLCPPPLRPAVVAVCRFARTAADLAETGQRPALDRLADLQACRQDLHAVYADRPPSDRWPELFDALGRLRREFHLPMAPFEQLLSGFEQEVTTHRYISQDALLAHCARVANPVGRLLLILHGLDDEAARRQSDALCSALQLTRYWRNLSVDTARGRLYVPLDLCRRHHVPVASLVAQQETPATQAMVRELVEWTRSLLVQGAPLARRLPGRADCGLRLAVQGALRILEKIARSNYAALHERPVLGAWDGVVLLQRALGRQLPASTTDTTA